MEFTQGLPVDEFNKNSQVLKEKRSTKQDAKVGLMITKLSSIAPDNFLQVNEAAQNNKFAEKKNSISMMSQQ